MPAARADTRARKQDGVVVTVWTDTTHAWRHTPYAVTAKIDALAVTEHFYSERDASAYARRVKRLLRELGRQVSLTSSCP